MVWEEWCECDEGVDVDDAEIEPEGRCAGAEVDVDDDEPVRWCGSGCALSVRDEGAALALALEDPLPVRVRVASGVDCAGGVGVWVEEPLRPRMLP